MVIRDGMTSPADLSNELRRIRPKHSTGSDGISNAALKKLPQCVLVVLSILFNHCINIKCFP